MKNIHFELPDMHKVIEIASDSVVSETVDLFLSYEYT